MENLSISRKSQRCHTESSKNSPTFETSRQDSVPTHTEYNSTTILQTARALCDEIETLRSHIKQAKDQLQIVGFLNHVKSELSILESRANSGKLDEPGGLSGTNLLYLDTVWRAAKCCKALVGFSRRMYWIQPPKGRYKKGSTLRERYTPKEKLANSVVVDAVTEGGAQWIKVSTITSKRIMYEMAEKGLSSEDLLEMQNGDGGFLEDLLEDDDDKISIIKIAEDLKKAASATRVKYKHPKVKMILPRLVSNPGDEVDVILERIRELGVELDHGTEVPNIPLSVSLGDGLIAKGRHMSETLNIDCTILLALISDISHTKHLNEPWFNQDTQRQVEGEDEQDLLPSIIYPVLVDHDLVCTDKAAERMRDIIDVVATRSEKKRASIMMGDDPELNLEQRIKEWNELSCHKAPESLKLPVKIVETNYPPPALSPIEQAVMEKLVQIKSSQVTTSVLMYGWSAQRTTLTSNATALKALNRAFEQQPAGEEAEGPDIWLCPIPRSLAGKEKDKGPISLRPSG